MMQSPKDSVRGTPIKLMKQNLNAVVKVVSSSMSATTVLKSSQKMNAPLVPITATLMQPALTLSSALHVSVTKAFMVMESIVILSLHVARLSIWIEVIIITSFVNTLTIQMTDIKVSLKFLLKK